MSSAILATKFKLFLFSFIVLLLSSSMIECNNRLLNQAFTEFINKSQTPKTQFKLWHYIFEKPYNLNSEFALQRYKIFKSNIQMFEEHNKKNLGYYFGLNPFTDLTVEEFKSAYLADIDMTNVVKSLNETTDPNYYPNYKKINNLKDDKDENHDEDYRPLKGNKKVGEKSISFDELADEYDSRDEKEFNNFRKLDERFLSAVTPYDEKSQILKKMSINQVVNGVNQQLTCDCSCETEGGDDSKPAPEPTPDPKDDPERAAFISSDYSKNYAGIKDMGSKCKASWAFAMTAVLEGRFNVKNNSTISLSEQQDIDCNTFNGVVIMEI